MTKIDTQELSDYFYKLINNISKNILILRQLTQSHFLHIFGTAYSNGNCLMDTNNAKCVTVDEKDSHTFTCELKLPIRCLVFIICDKFTRLVDLSCGQGTSLHDSATNSDLFVLTNIKSPVTIKGNLISSFQNEVKKRIISDSDLVNLLILFIQKESVSKGYPLNFANDNVPTNELIEYLDGNFAIRYTIGMSFLESYTGIAKENLQKRKVLDLIFSIRELWRMELEKPKTLNIPEFGDFYIESEDEFANSHFGHAKYGKLKDTINLKHLISNPIKELIIQFICSLDDYKFIKCMYPGSSISHNYFSDNVNKVIQLKSTEMADVYQKVKMYCKEKRIIILGDSGVGKQGIAELIHFNSKRTSDFIPSNVGGVSREAQESQLFGIEGGVFTDVPETQIGDIERAHKGTLFLDEIGDIDPDLQVKLLTCIEEEYFRRVGGKENIDADFQLVSATNKNINERVKEGFMREDFFARIAGVEIFIPPLRYRKEDILQLGYHFFTTQYKEFEDFRFKLTPNDFLILTHRDWKRSNVRDLKNHINRVVACLNFHFNKANQVPKDMFISALKDQSLTSIITDPFQILNELQFSSIKALINVKLENISWGLPLAAKETTMTESEFKSTFHTALILLGSQFDFNTKMITVKILTICEVPNMGFTIKIQNFIDERYKAIIKASEEKDIKLYHKLKIDQNIILKLKKLRTDLL